MIYNSRSRIETCAQGDGGQSISKLAQITNHKYQYESNGGHQARHKRSSDCATNDDMTTCHKSTPIFIEHITSCCKMGYVLK
jgi:hypothetical protein